MRISPMLRKLLKARRNKDIFIFIFFFVFASIIWYGHAMQSVRDTRVPVYIHYIGKPGNIGLGEEGLPEKVMIDVRDAGHRLAAYHETPLQITIDLHQYIHGDSGTILIPSNHIRASIKAALQANSNLLSTDPEQIRCTYYKEHEKEVNLVFDGEVQLADGYQLIGTPHLTAPKVTLYGKKEVLKTISSVSTEHQNIRNLSDTLRTRVRLALPQGVRAESDSVDLEIFAEQFTEKRFEIPIEVRHVPSGLTAHLFPETAVVSVRIGMRHYAQLQASDLKVYVVCPMMPKKKLEVVLDYSANPHITSAWVYPAEVEYLLEQ